jgi:hypothetical protein
MRVKSNSLLGRSGLLYPQSSLLANANDLAAVHPRKRHTPTFAGSTALRLLALASTLFCTSHAFAVVAAPAVPFTYAAYGYWETDVETDVDTAVLLGEAQGAGGTAIMVSGALGEKSRAAFGANGVALPSSGGYAVSVWSDGFVVNGGSGVGTLNLSIQLHGTLIAEADVVYALLKSDDSNAFSPAAIIADAGAGYINLPGTTPVLLVEVDDTPDYPVNPGTVFSLPSGFVNQVFNVSVSFTYGQTFYLASVLDIGGYGDFYNSADFGITAPDGTSITSLSGTLYPAAAVPEAETYAMMLAGLGLVGFMARRRKQIAA